MRPQPQHTAADLLAMLLVSLKNEPGVGAGTREIARRLEAQMLDDARQPAPRPQPVQKPSVGRVVHYLAPGSADGKFPAAHRAAVVTEVEGERVKVAVLNPTGLFFSDWLTEDPEGKRGVSWHWPERE